MFDKGLGGQTFRAKLYILCLLLANHNGMVQVEMDQDDLLMVARLEKGVFDVLE